MASIQRQWWIIDIFSFRYKVLIDNYYLISLLTSTINYRNVLWLILVSITSYNSMDRVTDF